MTKVVAPLLAIPPAPVLGACPRPPRPWRMRLHRRLCPAQRCTPAWPEAGFAGGCPTTAGGRYRMRVRRDGAHQVRGASTFGPVHDWNAPAERSRLRITHGQIVPATP